MTGRERVLKARYRKDSPMKRRAKPLGAFVAAWGVVTMALSVATAPAQEVSTAVEPEPAVGLVVTDSPWTAVEEDGSLHSLEGVTPDSQETSDSQPYAWEGVDEGPTANAPVLAQPQLVGDVTFDYVGSNPDGTETYELEASVVLPHTADGDVQTIPHISFVREDSTAPVVDVSDPHINGLPVPEASVEAFNYPDEGSGESVPADLPADVTGDLITFDTSTQQLATASTFAAEVQLTEVEIEPATWSLYTGDATATELNAGVATYNTSLSLAPSHGPLPANHTRVVVQVGGNRLRGSTTNSATTTSGRLDSVYRFEAEPGAVLQLYKPLNNNKFGNTEANKTNTMNDRPVPVNQPWATCTSDVNGECVFDIPVSGPDTFPYYWIAMTQASPGFEIQPAIRTGGSGNTGTDLGTELRYAYATPHIEEGKTYYSGVNYKRGNNRGWGSDWQAGLTTPTSFMYEVRSPWDGLGTRWDRSSLGVFQQVRENPPLPNRCGLRVGFIVDTSGSMGSQGINTIKTILNGGRIDGTSVTGVFDSLSGTQTQVGLVSFDNSSPGSTRAFATSRNIVNPLTISNSTDRGTARQWVDDLRSRNGGTNWEAALTQYVNYNEANPAATYDVVYMITDGNPTRLDTKSENDTGIDGEFRHVEVAMGMANTLKSQGTRVVPVGIPANWPFRIGNVGDTQLSVSDYNLQALSGSNDPGESTLRAKNFATFENADVFRQALINTLNTCAITVERRFYPGEDTDVVPTPENTEPTVQQSSDWGFDATLVPSVGSESKSTQLPEPTAGSDNLIATLELNGSTDYSSITIREQTGMTPQGWARMDAGGGQHAQCVDANGEPVQVTNLESRSATDPTNDFVLSDVPVLGGIHCIVYYRADQPGTFDLLLRKVDATDNTIALDGAAFELRRLDVEEGQSAVVPASHQSPGQTGEYMWNELELGRYELVETRAPADGYSLLPQPVYFAIDQNDGELSLLRLSGPEDVAGTEAQLSFPVVAFEASDNRVTMSLANVRSGTLPDTGGAGVTAWIAFGVLVCAVGAAIDMHNRRQRNRIS